MAFDLAAIRTELYAAHSYLNDGSTQATRGDYWINQAYKELCAEAKWPFLETATSGAAPLTISDLGDVISVRDTFYNVTLRLTTYDTLTGSWTDLTTQGSPVSYYITGGDTINTFPVTPSTSIDVRYVKVPVDLSSATDVPLVPAEYRDIIALGAQRRASIDNQAWTAAAAYKAEWDARVDKMRSQLLPIPDYQVITGGFFGSVSTADTGLSSGDLLDGGGA